jgi:hypothetical protein
MRSGQAGRQLRRGAEWIDRFLADALEALHDMNEPALRTQVPLLAKECAAVYLISGNLPRLGQYTWFAIQGSVGTLARCSPLF